MATVTQTVYHQPPVYNPPMQSTVVIQQPAVAAPRPFGSCPYCGGYLREQFSAFGILLCIIFFPLGLICCFMMREKRCTNCGRFANR